MTLAAWNMPAWAQLGERRKRNALPHALLLAGPSGLGKREFAEAFAALQLCERPGDFACGACRSCRLYAVRTQREPAETRPDGSLAHPWGHSNHPDTRFVGFALNEQASPKKMFGDIVVDQIRELSAWLVLAPQYEKAQVAIIDPADKLNVAAANALLKTLEEPGPGRYLVLVTSEPARLSATIRSRCQRIEFRVPKIELTMDWLAAQGVDARAAADALDASDGNPGLALEWLRGGGMTLRAEVAKDLREVNAGIANAFDVAQRWGREQPGLRLSFAAALVRQQSRALMRGGRDVSPAAGPLALTRAVELSKLATWFDFANRTRDLLRGPIRPELAMLDLLRDWAGAASRNVQGGHG